MADNFAGNILKSIFLNDNCWISYSNFTQVCSHRSNWELVNMVQVMVWRLVGGKPLPEPMLTKVDEAR